MNFCGCQIVDNNDDAIEFHTVPHAPCAIRNRFAEVLDLIEDVVSPEGIEPSTNRLRVHARAKSRRRRS